MITLSVFLIATGCILMSWGTLYVLRDRPFITKLHALGVSDTLGSILIVAGLILRTPERLIPLGVAFIALVFWGPLLTYVLARSATKSREWSKQ